MEKPASLLPTSFAVAKKCITDRSAHVGVVGLGPNGLRLCLLFSSTGFAVYGFELESTDGPTGPTISSRLKSLLADRLSPSPHHHRLHITANLSTLADTEVVVVCVPYRASRDLQPDFRSIRETVFGIAPNLHGGQLVVMETVSYPGATEEVIIPILEGASSGHLRVSRNSGAPNEIFVGISPEQPELGLAYRNVHDLPKIVSGIDRFGSDLTAELYGTIFKNVVRVSSTSIAETTRLFESSHYNVNIALANELKQICLRLGVDPWEVLDAASTAPPATIQPGPGVESEQIQSDSISLVWKARAAGSRAKLIEVAADINTDMPEFIVRSVGEALNNRGKSVNGSRVLVLGVTSETNIYDLRASPSAIMIESLRKTGAVVEYNDPAVPYLELGTRGEVHLSSVQVDDVSKYDVVIIAVHHLAYDYPRIVAQAKLVVDARNATRGMEAANIVRC